MERPVTSSLEKRRKDIEIFQAKVLYLGLEGGQDTDQVHVQGDGGSYVWAVLEVAEETHANVQTGRRIIALGTGDGTKTDDISEKFHRWRGSFSIQKIILQISDLYKGLEKGFLKKNAIWLFEIEGGS